MLESVAVCVCVGQGWRWWWWWIFKGEWAILGMQVALGLWTFGDLGHSPYYSVVLLGNRSGIWYALFTIQLMKY